MSSNFSSSKFPCCGFNSSIVSTSSPSWSSPSYRAHWRGSLKESMKRMLSTPSLSRGRGKARDGFEWNLKVCFSPSRSKVTIPFPTSRIAFTNLRKGFSKNYAFMFIITSINHKKSVGISLPTMATFRFLSTPSGLINLPSPMINLMIVASRFGVLLKSPT